MESGFRSAQLRKPTLFDTLSNDALSIIVKRMCCLLSKHERAVTSDSPGLDVGDPFPFMANMNMHFRFLALLFRANSPFRDAAAQTFVSEIEVCWPYPATSIIYLGRRVLKVGPWLFEGATDGSDLGRLVFSACGPYVRRISICDAPSEPRHSKHFMERFMVYVFQYCRNVEELTFWGYRAPLTRWSVASSFFREYAANLCKIDWLGEEDWTGFPDLRKCMSLRHLKSRKLNTGTLVSLLKACGSGIEELDISITPIGDSAEVIAAIRNYCKRLSLIYIENLEGVMEMVGQESYSSLICSFGPHLKIATVDGLGYEHLVEVVKACTNLEVDVDWNEKGTVDWLQVYNLGPRMSGLYLNATSLRGDVYSGALEQCSNLRELDLFDYFATRNQGITDGMIADVFSKSRFPKLEDLSVQYFRANARNMALIASCTAGLKSAFFVPFESDLEPSVFQIIVESQKHLKNIGIDASACRGTEHSVKSVLESLREFVEIFRYCRRLSFELTCSDGENAKEEDLIHIFKVLPCRGVDVHVQVGDLVYWNPK